MLQKIIKVFFLSLGYQIASQASIFLPKSHFLQGITHILAKEPMPTYVEKHVIASKGLNNNKFSDEKLSEYKEQFQKIKIQSVSNLEKMLFDSTGFSKNDEFSPLLEDLKKKQTPSHIKMLLEKQYASSLSKLGIMHPEILTTDSLRKEFSYYIVSKKEIDPIYSVFINGKIRNFFKTVLENIPQERITNISRITIQDTDPIKMPAANRARPDSRAYEILLSPKRSDAEIFFGLAHEFGHVLNLDSHRIMKAGQESFSRSIFKRILHHKKIDPYMAHLYRSREFIADTEVIMQLASTNLSFAIELCEHGINSCTNHIALEEIKYMGSGESGPVGGLTTHHTNDYHPTWHARLLILLKIYESLQT